MKKAPTKAEIRQQMEKEIESFLKGGGQIEKIPSGVSGRDDYSIVKTPVFDTPKQERTPVPELIANIESRRRQRPERPTPRKAIRRPKEKIIYDDFGEPVRRVWVEE